MDGQGIGNALGALFQAMYEGVGCLFVAAIIGGIGTLAGLVFFFLWLLGWV